ncbi:MAG: DsbC family protein [Deltaproteobacteria bacterium]|nr:DsbC family protein [Deltaproteobacteria bacterium]
MKKLTAIFLFILLLFPTCVFAKNVTSVSPTDKFKKDFPKNNFESITPTGIKGVYEVYTGNQLYYYMPKDDVILYGSLVSKNGVNITRESYLKKMAQKMTKLPLDSALKIGNGKITVVEFMDPNCYHCRQAYKFFSQRKDVTVNVFFFPLSKESGDKIKHILCSKDVLKTYEDVMNGKLDNNAPLSICTDKKVDDIVKTHMQISSQIGLRGTPLFYIKGQVIDGFDPPVIEKLLKD